MPSGYSLAHERHRLSSRGERIGPSAGISCAVEVVRGVDGARHALLTAIERLLAGIQPDHAGVEIVLFVQVLWEAVSVAKRAVDDAVRPPVRRLQIVTMEVVSQAAIYRPS